MNIRINFQNFAKFYSTNRKNFLQRCLKTRVILPSNHRRNVDRDLLLIQQAQRIDTDLQKLHDIIQTSLYQWKLLSDSDLRQLKRFEQAYRRD